MGLQDFFRFTVSPLEITYLPTSQKILFFGLDDPAKVKSVKVPFGYIAFLWFEEYDQFSSPDEIRSIEQSILRGGDLSLTFKTFNPPVSPSHWANLQLLEVNPSKIVSHSSYLDVPQDWLGKPFIQAAQHLAKVNPDVYRHEYLGIATGLGGNVFNNLSIREISKSERKSLSDRLYCGIDWGWYPDPFVFIRVAFLPSEQKLFILDEFSGNRLSNSNIADALKSLSVSGRDRIICDSAGEGQKSISDLRSRGFHAQAARKGPGSVDYSTKWLASLAQIIIDPVSCPLAAKEFSAYEFQKNRDGSASSVFPDKDNHSIDAVRYALEPIIRRGSL